MKKFVVHLRINDMFYGINKNAGIENPDDKPLELEVYQGWDVGYQTMTIPPHSETVLLSASSPACCARLKVVALVKLGPAELA